MRVSGWEGIQIARQVEVDSGLDLQNLILSERISKLIRVKDTSSESKILFVTDSPTSDRGYRKDIMDTCLLGPITVYGCPYVFRPDLEGCPSRKSVPLQLPTWLSELQHVGPHLALSATPVIITIIMPRLDIDSILWHLAHFLSRLLRSPSFRGLSHFAHVYLMLGYCPVGSCRYLVLGYCPAGSHILDSRRPPVLGGPNRTSSKFIDTFIFSFSYSFSTSFSSRILISLHLDS
ncbi:hypothetical protein YC2023_103666 [Brassica napus]